MSAEGMGISPVWRLAEWTGRMLLLCAVAFWWGAIVVPQLVSLTFHELLPAEAIPRNLDPDNEGNLANAVSAFFLLVTALLAFSNAIVSHRRALRLFGSLRKQDWIVAAGWTALAVTAAYLAWEEVSEFHAEGTRGLGETVFGAAYRSTLWPVVFSPLIVAFLLAMVVFIVRGLPSTSSGREVRALLVLGLAAWLLAIAQELAHTLKPSLFLRLLEEALEFGGTLVIGLSGALALRGRASPSGIFGARGGFPLRIRWLAAIAIVACVVALGAVAASIHRAPLADARARIHVGSFHLLLPSSVVGKHSLVQELGVLPAPPARIDLRVTNYDPERRPGTLIWRLMEADGGGSGRILREGTMEVPAGDSLNWESINFPASVETEGRPLALQLVAELEPGALLRVGATKTNRYEEGRLWVNGELAWPDQNIEFVLYPAIEPTLGKLRTKWSTFTSDWRWTVLAVDGVIGMTLITFIPALLVTVALPRRGSP